MLLRVTSLRGSQKRHQPVKKAATKQIIPKAIQIRLKVDRVVAVLRDGLSDAYEVNTSHTNPLLADTDGDGVEDAVEITAGTNPNDPRSVLIVTTSQRNANGSFTLSWAAAVGKTYRVLHSSEPGFASYTVVASSVVAAVPVTTFTDTTLGAQTPQVFYRVEVE